MPADESSFSAAASSSTSGAGSAASGASARATSQVEADVARLVKQGVSDLEKRKRSLELEIEKLERRRDRIDAEMKTTFAGASQDLAVRVQGFKEYLVGSLQDLAAAAEQLDMQPPAPAPRQERERAGRGRPSPRPGPRTARRSGCRRFCRVAVSTANRAHSQPAGSISPAARLLRSRLAIAPHL
jgi:hypothetical protein